MRRIAIVVALAGVIAGPAAHAGGGSVCHKPSNEAARGTEILIVDSCIAPGVLEVEPGTLVRWITKDAFDHTITSGTGHWPEAIVSSATTVSSTFTERFNRPGLYPWYCRYHLSMGGVVAVGDIGATPLVSSEPQPRGSGVVPSAGIASLFGGSVGFLVGRRRRDH